MVSPAFEIGASKVEMPVESRPKCDKLLAAGYGLTLLISISVWFLAVRAPLWVDETLSYWQIASGFNQIWTRSIQGNSFAAYAYILWLTKTIFGGKEVILRIPSILAMLAATYVFYRCARELFTWDVSIIATTLFVLPRGIAFAAIDVRPYAFALLATNLTLLMFLRWVKTGRTEYAAYFGIAAGSIFYFHYLFAVILGALAIVYLVAQRSSLKPSLRQIGVVFSCFAIVILPVIPRLRYIYQTRASHSFAEVPQLTNFLQAIYPGAGQVLVLVGAVLLGALSRTLMTPTREVGRKFAFCVAVGLIPIGFLYVLSVVSSVHVFISRYLLVGVPGVTLIWAWFCSLIDSRLIRALFCFAFVGLCAFQAYNSPVSRMHEESWKESLAYADANAAEDHAPLLMCSPLVEADFQPMPQVPSDSVLYAPLSYYKVNAPVVPLPRTLNQEAMSQVTRFLLKETPEHQRFLMLVPWPSVPILNFLSYSSQGSYAPHVLGNFDGILVVEFIPRS